MVIIALILLFIYIIKIFPSKSEKNRKAIFYLLPILVPILGLGLDMLNIVTLKLLGDSTDGYFPGITFISFFIEIIIIPITIINAIYDYIKKK